MVFPDPNPEFAFFILRLALGILFLAHGPSKLQNPAGFAKSVGLPKYMGIVVGLLETLGAAAMILGIGTQVGAVFLMAVMLGAIYFKTQKWEKSFTEPGGWELDFIILAAALAVFLAAPSGYSLWPII